MISNVKIEIKKMFQLIDDFLPNDIKHDRENFINHAILNIKDIIKTKSTKKLVNDEIKKVGSYPFLFNHGRCGCIITKDSIELPALEENKDDEFLLHIVSKFFIYDPESEFKFYGGLLVTCRKNHVMYFENVGDDIVYQKNYIHIEITDLYTIIDLLRNKIHYNLFSMEKTQKDNQRLKFSMGIILFVGILIIMVNNF